MSSAEEWFDRYREDVASELVMHCPDPTVPVDEAVEDE